MEKAFFDFVSILNKLKIPWWLDGGQLLRLYREDAFALNEVDFDIGVFYSDISKSVIKTILNSGYDYWFLAGDKNAMGLGFQKDHIYFFHLHLYYIENSKMRYSMFFNKNKLFGNNTTESELIEFQDLAPDNISYPVHQRFDVTYSPFTTKEIIYKGNKLIVPEDVEKLLIENYGETWKTPAKVWHTHKMRLNIKPTNIVNRNYPILERKVHKHINLTPDGKIKPDLLLERKLDNLG